MVDSSLASSDTLVPWMPVDPSPSIEALTSVEILFSVKTPDPPKLYAFDPVEAPTATATEITSASMSWVEVAVAEKAPPAATLESST